MDSMINQKYIVQEGDNFRHISCIQAHDELKDQTNYIHLSWCWNKNALIQIGIWIQELIIGMWLDLLGTSARWKKWFSIIKSIGGQCHLVIEKGNIMFNHDSRVKQVEYVLLVLRVTKNLLFVGSIINKGCYVLFGAKKCWVLNAQDLAKVLAEGYIWEQANGLYKLSICQQQIHSNQQQVPLLMMFEERLIINLWHWWFGHLNI